MLFLFINFGLVIEIVTLYFVLLGTLCAASCRCCSEPLKIIWSFVHDIVETLVYCEVFISLVLKLLHSSGILLICKLNSNGYSPCCSLFPLFVVFEKIILRSFFCYFSVAIKHFIAKINIKWTLQNFKISCNIVICLYYSWQMITKFCSLFVHSQLIEEILAHKILSVVCCTVRVGWVHFNPVLNPYCYSNQIISTERETLFCEIFAYI